MVTLLRNMSMFRRIIFGFLFLMILGAAGLTLWWTLRPQYQVLANNLRPADASEIASTLSKWGVAYQFGEDGKSLMVPSGQLYQTRIRLAEQGIPRGGAVGFEAFKDSDYGVTQFAQRVNYQRALQGELERTIDAMREVQFSRVHLTIHHAGLFDSNKEASKGAVTLALRPGMHIHGRQIRGIQRLVASSVEGLEPDAVTVLDQTGTVLSHAGGAEIGSAVLGDRMSQASKIETGLKKQASALVRQALGTDDFTVSVAVRLNYDKVHRVSQRILDDGRTGHGTLVSEKITTQEGGASAGDHGHTDVRDRVTTYAHGNEREEIDQAPGRIEAVSVGIVIPGHLTKTQVVSLDHVVSAGLGLDASRGDRIDIASSEHVVDAVTSSHPGQPHVAPKPIDHAHLAREAAKNFSKSGARGLSIEIYEIIAAVFIFLVALALWLMRRRALARLTHDEREQMLERIRTWCEEPVQ